MSITDHYATLGVEPTAKAGEIRAAYLALMREYHPDRNRDPAAVDRAQAVIAAFKVLGDFDRRNRYDWGRRREREAAAAQAAKRPRQAHAGAVAAGAAGLVAAGVWAFLPEATPEPRRIGPPVVEVRPVPVASVAAATQRAEPVRPRTDQPKPVLPKPVQPPPVRIAMAEPVRAPAREAAKVEKVAKIAPKPVRPAQAEPDPMVRVAAINPPAVRVAPSPPAPRQTSPATTDLASLDQFVMNFYGQSWRVGDAARRAALERSRSSFVARRAECLAEPCKRDAYLKLMRDVSEIVETGQTKSR